MDLSYLALIVAFLIAVYGLALGCARLTARKDSK
jgi:hypothetical protein